MGGVGAVAVTPDGHIVSGSADRTVKVWDPATRTATTTLSGHTGAVRAVAITAGGHIVSGGQDRTVKVWHIGGTGVAAEFTADGPVLAVAVAPDGTIVAGDELGRVHVLRLAGA